MIKIITEERFSYNQITFQVISRELIRNLTLAFATIVCVTLVLVANLWVSFFVLVCVIFTVVDVCGYSYFMGITIEIVTSIILILSCGLALDYAAHIGVAFMCSKEKTREGKE
jgi:Niemann-Pick C1 protein